VTFSRPQADHANFVLREINLALWDGAVLAVIGPTQSGKTALIHFVQGMLGAPAAGQVFVGGHVWLGQTPEIPTPKRRARLAVVTDPPRVPLGFSVGDAVTFYLTRSGTLTPERRLWRENLLAALGLHTHMAAQPALLEANLRLRVSLACAFATEPDLILWDDFSADACPLLTRALALRRTCCGVLVAGRDAQAIHCATTHLALGGGSLQV
jgi:ABC-type sulfate/molybdate transport systems ATPase subunit